MIARLSRPLALLLALALIALSAWCLTAKPPPIKTAAKGGYTDVHLYHDITAEVVKGTGYYPAAAKLQRAHHYPLKPFVTVRLPTLIWGAALIGWSGMQKVAMGLAIAGVILWAIGTESFLHWTERVLVAGAIGAGASMVVNEGLLALHEYWGGFFITIALALRLGWREKWWLSLGAVACGLAVRELVLPFALLALVFAMVEKRENEAWGWGALIIGFLVMLGFHAHFEHAQVRPGDIPSPGWKDLQGYSAFLKAVIFTSLLQNLARPFALLCAMLPLFGWAALDGRRGAFCGILVVGYIVLIAVFSRPDTFYWGAMALPWYFAGFALLPRAAWQLVQALRFGPQREPALAI